MQPAAAKDSEASGETATAYDHVRYPGHPFVETHPDQLATLGSVFGMHPARLDSCRVLELGCGQGANLIPFAFQWPESEFVGIDLSATAIDAPTLVAEAAKRDVHLAAMLPRLARVVFHLDVDDNGLDQASAVLSEILDQSR